MLKLPFERQNFSLKYIKGCLTNTLNSFNELDYILDMRYFHSLNPRTLETIAKRWKRFLGKGISWKRFTGFSSWTGFKDLAGRSLQEGKIIWKIIAEPERSLKKLAFQILCNTLRDWIRTSSSPQWFLSIDRPISYHNEGVITIFNKWLSNYSVIEW